MNHVKKLFFVLATIVLLSGTFLKVVSADNDKVNVCHKTGSQTNPWVAQSVSANQLQSHLDNGDFLYNGPLHNGMPDNQNHVADAWCNGNVPTTPTPTPTVTPTVTPALDCDGDTDGSTPNEDDEDCVAPTVTPTPTATPTPTVTVAPTATPSNGSGSTGGDGKSDGLGCGSHDCSQHANGSAPIQAVLAASTFAGTGTFENTIMTLMLVAGMIVVSLGGLSYAKERNK